MKVQSEPRTWKDLERGLGRTVLGALDRAEIRDRAERTLERERPMRREQSQPLLEAAADQTMQQVYQRAFDLPDLT